MKFIGKMFEYIKAFFIYKNRKKILNRVCLSSLDYTLKDIINKYHRYYTSYYSISIDKRIKFKDLIKNVYLELNKINNSLNKKYKFLNNFHMFILFIKWRLFSKSFLSTIKKNNRIGKYRNLKNIYLKLKEYFLLKISKSTKLNNEWSSVEEDVENIIKILDFYILDGITYNNEYIKKIEKRLKDAIESIERTENFLKEKEKLKKLEIIRKKARQIEILKKEFENAIERIKDREARLKIQEELREKEVKEIIEIERKRKELLLIIDDKLNTLKKSYNLEKILEEKELINKFIIVDTNMLLDAELFLIIEKIINYTTLVIISPVLNELEKIKERKKKTEIPARKAINFIKNNLKKGNIILENIEDKCYYDREDNSYADIYFSQVLENKSNYYMITADNSLYIRLYSKFKNRIIDPSEFFSYIRREKTIKKLEKFKDVIVSEYFSSLSEVLYLKEKLINIEV